MLPAAIAGQALIVLSEVLAPTGRLLHLGRGGALVTPGAPLDVRLLLWAVAGLAIGGWGMYLVLRVLLATRPTLRAKALACAPALITLAGFGLLAAVR